MDGNMETVISELKECYDKYGIIAGKHHYSDYWTRDAYFGWLGALDLGDNHIVKIHLQNLAKYQRTDGCIPFLIRQTFPGLSFLGVKKYIKPFPKFRSHKVLYTSEVIDSNAYFIMGFNNYLERTQDLDFVNKNITSLKKAFDWYTTKMGKNFLVKEGLIAQWNDGIYKRGNVLITNIQVFYSAICMANIQEKLGLQNKTYLDIAQKIRESILTNFSHEDYMIDWINKNKKYDYTDSIANMLAIIWDVVDEDRAEKILHKIKQDLYDKPLVKTCFPEYRVRQIELINRAFGIGGYWQGKDIYWIEPGLLYTWALIKCKKIEEASAAFEGIKELVEEHSGVYETYKRVGNKFYPFKTALYTSENPYARGAGLYIIVNNQITTQNNQNMLS